MSLDTDISDDEYTQEETGIAPLQEFVKKDRPYDPVDVIVDPESVTIDDIMTQADMVFNDVAKVRKLMQDTLESAVSQMTLHPDEGAEAIGSKLAIIDSLNKITESREKSFMQRVTMRQKKASTEAAENILSALATSVLQKIPTAQVNYVVEANDAQILTAEELDKLEAQVGASKVEIKETELKR